MTGDAGEDTDCRTCFRSDRPTADDRSRNDVRRSVDSGSDVGARGSNGHSPATSPTAVPLASEIPAPTAVCEDETATGAVVWHRKHLRIEDHRALAAAVAGADAVCPLFVFDPSFYGSEGLACDARIRLLHEALASLDRLYAAVPTRSSEHGTAQSRKRLVETTPLDPGHDTADSETLAGADDAALDTATAPGLTFGFGDPVEVLARFVERGWSVVTMATPTSRYGKRRDERVRTAHGDAVEFVSGDGLVRGREWPRTDWQDHVSDWLATPQHTPEWREQDPVHVAIETGVTPAVVDDAHAVAPTKTRVPTGSHRQATSRLEAFVDRIHSYPGNISAPQDAREGTSGLSPYLNFGLLSIRQVYQYVTEHAPACRGRDMFTDRLIWNLHYNQKLVDWPGWTDRAVNPVLEGFNADHHDPALVDAWKHGRTGFPMVDAAMRCLERTGWLNFRMRAMAASFYAHILHQPWWIGADWYHHHLIDSDVGINYTQWQSQAGLIGKPGQRVYNPRKQVRDHDPDGAWITRWVPELSELPPQFLDRPERTPVAIQKECGVSIGEDYPRPVVDFDARREAFWSRYEQVFPDAARELGRRDVARRASFSGGYSAAAAIAEKHGRGAGEETGARQVSLTEAGDDGTRVVVPTGVGERTGQPSPDDRAAVPDHRQDPDDTARESERDGTGSGGTEQTTFRSFD